MKTKTVLVTALAIALTFGAALRADTSPERQLIVSGEGQIEIAPDLAVITLGVSKEAKDVECH